MRKILTIVLLFCSLAIFGQTDSEYKTIFGEKKGGGYGSFSIGYSQIDDSDALMLSSRGGMIFSQSVALGIAGSGFVSAYKFNPDLNKKGSLAGGYGGVFLEFIVASKLPVHINFPILAGLGATAYTTWENEGTNYDPVNDVQSMATFLVIEPGVELEVNTGNVFRVAAYMKYRFTNNVDISTNNLNGVKLALVNPEALNTISAGLIFKFGRFR